MKIFSGISEKKNKPGKHLSTTMAAVLIMFIHKILDTHTKKVQIKVKMTQKMKF